MPNESFLAGEPSALGAFAEEGGFPGASPASPGNGSPSAIPEDNEGAVPSTGLGNASMPGMPLLPSPSAKAFSALVTGLLTPSSSAEGFKDPANYPRASDLDSLFLEIWDDDQLLFPDALPPIDETLFPEVMPKLDEMSAPNAPASPDDFSSELGQNNPASIAAPAAGEDTIIVGMEDAPAFAAPANMAGNAWSFAPIFQAVPTTVRFNPAAARGGTHAKPAHSAGAAGPAVSHGNEWQDGVSIAPDAAEEPASEDNLRPYQIALGMMPFLPAFGYTPVSLREHVRAGRRAWKRLRDYLHDW
jgi:hypothetical protein